ncbi:MAG: ABC transporter ATP-binding protein [Anaerolineae bacterium]|jgi:energy-coupling factor transport system ATP-binding protein
MPDAAIRLDGCTYTYGSVAPALQEVSCSIETGTRAAIIGPNGSGKTTLAKLCNGLLRPQEGRVRILGRDIRGRPVGQVARAVGYLFQNPDHQIFAATVRQEIEFGLKNLGYLLREREQRVEEALSLFDLQPFAERPPATMSFGLRRQVTVASLFALRPPILILDEPTTGLDGASTRSLFDRLAELRDGGHTILLITHDMRLVAEWADDVLVLRRGHLVAQGSAREILAQADLLARVSVSPPPVTRLSQQLAHHGMRGDSLTIEEFYREYRTLVEEMGAHR